MGLLSRVKKFPAFAKETLVYIQMSALDSRPITAEKISCCVGLLEPTGVMSNSE